MKAACILLFSLCLFHLSIGAKEKRDGSLPASRRVGIKVRYNATNEFLPSDYKPVSMWLYGNTMGPTWNKGVRMEKTALNMWQLVMNITHHSNIVFRISLNNMRDMFGANYYISLPPSTNFEQVTYQSNVTVYPWFFSKNGTVRQRAVYSRQLGENRDLLIYTPPSFFENQYKQYETMFLNDGQDIGRVIPIVEELIVGKATMKEILIVGIINSGEERSMLLAPTNGTSIRCREGTHVNGCNNCRKCRRSDCSYEETLIDMVCYVWDPIKQIKGEFYLDFIQHTLIRHAQDAYRALNGQRYVAIAGFSMGGLLSCHALWTRPHVFGSAVCMSPSLWWPFPGGDNIFPRDTGYEFVRETLMKNRGVRPRQKLYIGVGSEEGAVMIDPARNVTRMLLETPYFVLDENLWFYIWQDGHHNFGDVITHYWLALLTMYGTDGGTTWSQGMAATSDTDIHYGHPVSSCLALLIQLYIFMMQ